jgi:hypothetical protein
MLGSPKGFYKGQIEQDRLRRIQGEIDQKAREASVSQASEDYSRHVEQSRKMGMTPLDQNEFEVLKQQAPISPEDISQVEALPDIVTPPSPMAPGTDTTFLDQFTQENIQRAAEERPALEAYEEQLLPAIMSGKSPVQVAREEAQEATGAESGFFAKLGDVYEPVADMMTSPLRAMGEDGRNIITGETYKGEKGREIIETQANVASAQLLKSADEKILQYKKGGALPEVSDEEAGAWMADQESAIVQASGVAKAIVTDAKTRNRFFNDMIRYLPGDLAGVATGSGLASIAKRMHGLAKATKSYQKVHNAVKLNPRPRGLAALSAQKQAYNNAYGELRTAIAKQPAIRTWAKNQTLGAMTEVGLEHADTQRLGMTEQDITETFVQNFLEDLFLPASGVVTGGKAIKTALDNRKKLSEKSFQKVKESLYSKKPQDISEAAKHKDVAKIAPEIIKAQESEKTKGPVQITTDKPEVTDAKDYTEKGTRTVKGSQGGDFDQVAVTGAGSRTDLAEELVHRAQTRVPTSTRSELKTWEESTQETFEQKGEKLPFTGAELSAKKILFDNEGTTGSSKADAVLAKIEMPKALAEKVMQGKATPPEIGDKKYSLTRVKRARNSSLKDLLPDRMEQKAEFQDLLVNAGGEPLHPGNIGKAAEAKNSLTNRVKEGFNALAFAKTGTDLGEYVAGSVEYVINRNFPIQRFEQKMEKAGAKMPPKSERPFTYATMYPATIADRLKTQARDVAKPLVDYMKAENLTVDELGMMALIEIKPYSDKIAAERNPDFMAKDAKRVWQNLETSKKSLEKAEADFKTTLSEDKVDYLKVQDAKKQVAKYKEEVSSTERQWKNVEKVDPTRPGSGLTADMAERAEAKLRKAGKWEAAKHAVKRVQRMNNKTIRDAWEGGIITKKEYVDMTRAYHGKHVPLLNSIGEVMTIGGSLGVVSKNSKKLKVSPNLKAHHGRVDMPDVDLIVPNSMYNLEQIQVTIEKNKLANSIIDFFEENPDPSLGSIDPEPRYEYVTDPDSGMSVKRPKQEMVEHLDAMKEGELRRFYPNMSNPVIRRMIYAATQENRHEVTTALRVMGRIGAEAKKNITSRSPSFFLKNVSRDAGQIYYNISTEHGSDLVHKTFLNLPKTGAFLLREEVGGAPKAIGQDAEKIRAIHRRFKKAGGQTDFAGLQYPDLILAELDKAVEGTWDKQLLGDKKLTKKVAGGAYMVVATPVRILKPLVAAIENAIGVSENMWRFSMFQMLVEPHKDVDGKMVPGLPDREAAFITKRGISVDFDQRGASEVLNMLFFFSSVNASGVERYMTNMVNQPKKYIKHTVAKLTAISAALATYNYYMGGEDEDGRKYWDLIGDYEKNNNLILLNPIPGKDGKKSRTSIISIPVAPLRNLSLVVGNMGVDIMTGKKKAGEAVGDLAMEVVNAATPFGISNMEESAGLLETFTPSIAKPIVYTVLGRDWQNRPIYLPEYKSEGLADAYNYNYGTNKGLIFLAKGANSLTGGTQNRSGGIDVSPATLDQFYKLATGGLGVDAAKSLDLLISAFDIRYGTEKKQEEGYEHLQNVKNWPILRGVKTRVYTTSAYRILQESQDYADKRKGAWDDTQKVFEGDSPYNRKPRTKEGKEKLKQQREYAERFKMPIPGGKSSDINLQIYHMQDVFKTWNTNESKLRDTKNEFSEARSANLRKKIIGHVKMMKEIQPWEERLTDLDPAQIGGNKHESIKRAIWNILKEYKEQQKELRREGKGL